MINNKNTYLIALFFCSLLFVIVVLVKPKSEPQLIEGVVVSQNVTHSLDGNRRYLNVVTKDNHTLLIEANATIDCPKESHVTIQQQQSLFSDLVSYKVLTCSQ